MNFNKKPVLGKTGLQVGRIGFSSSFGAPAVVFEEAFELLRMYYREYQPRVWLFEGKPGSPYSAERVVNVVKKAA
jgi:hypothetical protein